jgi:hypothetical protein
VKINALKLHVCRCLFLGKWLLTNCAEFIRKDEDVQRTLLSCRLFLNSRGELCSCQQMFDPNSFCDQHKKKFLKLFGSKYLPSDELRSISDNFTTFKYLKLKQYGDITGEELIDICESTIKESTLSSTEKSKSMADLANFIVDILSSNPKLIDDRSHAKNISVHKYLNITQWIPVMTERPSEYPSTLTWRGKTII